MQNPSPSTIDFGYEQIGTEEKVSRVRAVFDSVAPKYDLMNNLMSGGIHHLWKHDFISMLNPQEDTSLLDVAGGTGDIALRFLERTQSSTVTLCDININMLMEGKNRFVNANISERAEFATANAEQLPFGNMTYDYYTIAFGIRNVTDRLQALKEAYRVLKPGGRFLCLEFSPEIHPLIKKPYDFYSHQVIPRIGEFIAKDKESYQYLVESIRMFPSPEQFASLIREAGFSHVTYRKLTGGLVAIHSGWRV